MAKYVLIGAGGFLGADLRYTVQIWAAGRWGSGFPFGTLIANITGSFLLAFFITLATQRIAISPEWRLFFAIGFVGGYTTFSSFSMETVAILQQGNWLWGGLNLLTNVAFGLTATILGILLARAL
jgi:CrcB protein